MALSSSRTSTRARATSSRRTRDASLLFPWYPLRRQVIVIGAVVTVARSGPTSTSPRAHTARGSARGQPAVERDRDRGVLERALAELERRYPPEQPVPRPERWGGFRVEPETVEFWQGRRDRLHDRLRYRREAPASGSWSGSRRSRPRAGLGAPAMASATAGRPMGSGVRCWPRRAATARRGRNR